MRHQAVRLLLPALAVAAVAALGLAIWSSTGQPGRGSSPTSTGAASVGAVPPGGSNSEQVRTSTVHGAGAGYQETVLVTRTDVASRTLTVLDVLLTTEATPASAPSAEATLTGADGIRHHVPLTIVGAGHWTSGSVPLTAGRYILQTRFDRQGAAVSITTPVSLS